MLRLHEGAILIADVHCAPYRSDFLNFLEALEKGEIRTTQLALMGDIFDVLSAELKNSVQIHMEVIARLNALAQSIEILYLEGNHDFRLAALFPSIRVIALQAQPCIVEANGYKVALAHGDWSEPLGYQLFTRLLRSWFVVKIINFYDTQLKNSFMQKLQMKLSRKNLCKNNPNLIAKKSKLLTTVSKKANYLFEGHFHQGIALKMGQLNYHNLDAFACNKSYFVVQFLPNGVVLNRHLFKEKN